MDGLKVNMDLQYQYRLIPELDEVLKLYYTWGYRHKYCFALVAYEGVHEPNCPDPQRKAFNL